MSAAAGILAGRGEPKGCRMMRGTDRRTKASYGLDAPGFLPFALLAFAASIIAAMASRRPGPIVGAAVLLWCIGFFLHTTRRGKFLVWRELIDDLRLQGGERI